MISSSGRLFQWLSMREAASGKTPLRSRMMSRELFWGRWLGVRAAGVAIHTCEHLLVAKGLVPVSSWEVYMSMMMSMSMSMCSTSVTNAYPLEF